MSKRTISAVFVAVFFMAGQVAPPFSAQVEKCDSAYDMVVQAREQARPDISKEQAEYFRSKLKTATSMCGSSGDAWYYRYLYSLRLEDKADADYALRQARRTNAEGLRRNDNPFAPVLAAKEVKLPPFVREKWALVVGVGQFQYPGVNPLKYTAKDARDFAALLTNPDYGRFKKANVTLLVDAEATTTRIKSEIEQLSEVARPEDLVVVYISTHGSPRDMAALDVNYIVTYDTNPKRLYATSLPMVEVTRDAKKMIPAERMVIILDTCFSGAAAMPGAFLEAGMTLASNSASDGSRDLSGGSRKISFSSVSRDLIAGSGGGAGHVTISASQPAERSWESGELQNGVFTYYLIEALKQNAGMDPINKVFNSLQEQVSQRVRLEKKQQQRPMMEPRETNADIRIGVPPQSD
jgi:uncharacterized caspase-like protein